MQVLVVDDSSTILARVTAAVVPAGHIVQRPSSAEAALWSRFESDLVFPGRQAPRTGDWRSHASARARTRAFPSSS